MPTRDEAWPAGTPNWIDLAAPDPAKAAAFYSELFGWTPMEGGDDQTGGYILCLLGDRAVAGIGPLPSPEAPPNWSTYIATDDADAAAEKIKAAGGSLHMDPFDVMGHGRMFFATAPDGATFGVWQAASMIGAGITAEPGALSWNELHSNDLDAARAFYGEVFGYTYDDITNPEFTYFIAKLPGAEQGIAGFGTNEMAPPGTPSHWMTWFESSNTDKTVAKAMGLGAHTLMEASDSPFGRMAILVGSQGEMFGVVDSKTTVGEAPPAN